MNIISKFKRKLDDRSVERGYAEYSIDALSVEGFIGWARKAGDTSAKSSVVKLCCGEKVIAEGVANQYREDLHELGYGDGCLGFNLTVNWRALDTGENKLTFFVDDHKVKIIRLPIGLAEFIAVAIREAIKK